jgi:NAD(P)-dependent dehydrogenase (short-subunit alcohol dehydrogenase family)
VVTGATSGIGREVAQGFAALGARTVLVGRGASRVAAAAEAIARATGNAEVDSIAVEDLAVLSETRRVGETLLQRYGKIHILVNNAGAYYRRREVTPEGIERTFALNVLSPFLLTSLLAGRLIESAPARVVNVSSAAHRGYAVEFDDLQGTRRFAGYRAYGQSKLELLLLTREFARRLEGTGVLVNAVHPGFVRSGFGQNNGGGTAFVIRILAALFGRSVQRGAETPLYVATDPAVGRISGEYFSDHRVDGASPQSHDMSVAHRLYDVCRELTGAAAIPAPQALSPASLPAH